MLRGGDTMGYNMLVIASISSVSSSSSNPNDELDELVCSNSLRILAWMTPIAPTKVFHEYGTVNRGLMSWNYLLEMGGSSTWSTTGLSV